MNSDQIFLVIEAVAGVSGKKAKEEIIRANALEEFKRVLRAALDPSVTYGIAKVPPQVTRLQSGEFDNGTWEMLQRLASRQLTGAAARGAVVNEINALSPASGELLKRILTKDLRAGFTEGTVNRVIPGLIPTFECQLAYPYDAKRVKRWPIYVEPKIDGVRTLARVSLSPTPIARFFSRSGKEFTTFDHLKAPLLEAFRGSPADVEFVVDCEVVSGNFNKTVSEVRKKSKQMTDAVLVVFDVLTGQEFDVTESINSRDLPYHVDGPARDMDGFCTLAPVYADRRKRLLKVFIQTHPHDLAAGNRIAPIVAMPAYEVLSEHGVHDLYETWRDLGLEGAMAKLADAYYRKDRDYGWMKLKAEQSVDLPIVGAEEGTGKYVGTLGALIVDFKGVQVRVSGMTDKQRSEMWDAWLSDVEAGAADGKPIVERPFELVGRLAEVLFHEITPDGSLRHPRFKRFRDDKAVAVI